MPSVCVLRAMCVYWDVENNICDCLALSVCFNLYKGTWHNSNLNHLLIEALTSETRPVAICTKLPSKMAKSCCCYSDRTFNYFHCNLSI